ncbi:MAG: DUF6785 family protein [Armatimonadota bacterium]
MSAQQTAPRTEADAATRSAPLTARALVLGLVCVAILCVAIPYTTGFMHASELGGCHFPVGPIFLLVVVVLPVSWLSARLTHRWALTQQDNLIVTAMMLVAAGIPTFGLALYLFPVTTAPFYMASVENQWEETFFGYLPPWIAPGADSTAVRWFYDGAPPGMDIPWGQWATPLVAWSILTFGLYLAMFCLGAIVRRQWVARENLIFPLVQLPLEMIMPQRHDISAVPFFQNKLLWIGFAIPFLVHNLNALHAYLPGIPLFKLQGISFLSGVTGRPWRYLQSPIYVHFSVIGFAFFLTTEISLSLWVFWWLGRLQHVAFDAIGRRPTLARVEENQYQGAFLMYVVYGLWVARGHLSEMWEAVVKHRALSGDERAEAMAPPVAFWGLLVAGGIVVAWLNMAGMSVLVAALTYVIFLAICWGMARLVVESGILFAKAVQMRPSVLLTGLAGSSQFAAADLTILNFTEYVFMYDLKSFLMPQILHGLKIADEARINRRHMYYALAVAVGAAVLISYWASLEVAYSKGALAMHPWFFISGPRGNAERLKSMLINATGVEANRLIALGVGAGLCALLIRARQLFLWFPLHPIAYVVGTGFEASRMWFPFFVGWVAKAMVTRYGSVQLYRGLQVPFLGLVLGEYTTAGLWLIIDALLGKVGHRVFP